MHNPEPNPLKIRMKRYAFRILFIAILVVFPATVIEWVYRMQWIDTYRAELQAYNSPEVIDGKQDSKSLTLLTLGDSFTAGTATYPEVLRRMMPNWRIVNGGISGTGIAQATIVAPQRLKQFRPDICVYQIYVGNDLFDIRYPWRSANLTTARRTYWFLASHLRSFGFINYRLGQIRAGARTTYSPAPTGTISLASFSPERYDARERLYFAAEPEILENHIYVTEQRAADYDRFLRGLEALRKQCATSGAHLVLLVIPHAVQVAPVYAERMRTLGASLDQHDQATSVDYPFLFGIREAFEEAPRVTVVDPLPALTASERDGSPVYFSNDGHLNEVGQHCVAQELLRAISGRTD